MTEQPNKQRLLLNKDSAPKLKSFVKLRHDQGRDRWVILAPERILTPDAISVEVLNLCDGERTITAIATKLAKTYNAPTEVIESDITTMLQDLSDKGYLTS